LEVNLGDLDKQAMGAYEVNVELLVAGSTLNPATAHNK
jgi:hypothetical protein